jgi:hypothetical protein
MKKSPAQIALESIALVNSALARDANAIMGVTRQGESPESAYVALIASLVGLATSAK